MDIGEIAARVGVGIGGPFGSVGKGYLEEREDLERMQLAKDHGYMKQDVFSPGSTNYAGLGQMLFANNIEGGLPFLQEDQSHGNTLTRMDQANQYTMGQIGARSANAQALAGIQHDNAMTRQIQQQGFLQEQSWGAHQAKQMALQQSAAAELNRPLDAAQGKYVSEASTKAQASMRAVSQFGELEQVVKDEGAWYGTGDQAKLGRVRSIMANMISTYGKASQTGVMTAEDEIRYSRELFGSDDPLSAWTGWGVEQMLGAMHQSQFRLISNALNQAGNVTNMARYQRSNKMGEAAMQIMQMLPEGFRGLDPTRQYSPEDLYRSRITKNE